MRNFKSLFFIVLGMAFTLSSYAYINPKERQKTDNNREVVSHREDCDNAVSQIDQAINNVRARLLTGGDVWWDGDDGRYIVPKVPAGVPEVSSIFAGAVWLGGVDPAGNLKLAAQQYGTSSGDSDFWPGPLDPVTGKTEQEVCAKWDKFFVVKGENIDLHIQNWNIAQESGEDYKDSDIPKDVRGWPARGNEFFFDVHNFELPNTSQGLAGFYDLDGDGFYEPDGGDYPIIEIRGCPDPQYADEMIFWIYNDAGNIHSESQGDPIQMEVQVQAFAYATNDEINDMTFQRYKLINRAIESIDSTFFAMWADPDLGCYTDDYVGCDTLRDLAYVYNSDAADGTTGCSCDEGVNTYCEEIPICGIDYFRGPVDEEGKELGMSAFTYYNNGGIGSPPTGTTDPSNAQEFYNYLTGSWRDGSPFTYGGDAYQDGFAIDYAFTEAPDDANGWSMCSQNVDPNLDRRTIQASGPFRLDPGAVNELIVGMVWVPDQVYPCPSILKLQEADDIAQALFDNCFDITDGPDAPDVDFIELDRKLVAVFTNDTISSNNAYEAYGERGLTIPETADDTLYHFEGYKFYQLAGPEVTISDLDNPDKARLIFQADVQNGVNRVFNWETIDNPTGEIYYVPELMIEGQNEGVRHTFEIEEDQFASGNRRLVNHKKYYFTALAYAHNEYEPFDPQTVIGQRQPYLEGRRNIGDGINSFYTAIPRPIVDKILNSEYGDGPVITRIDGIGNGANFIDISTETREAIINESFNGEIVYRGGRGPVKVNVFNPLDVKDGEYELTFIDNNQGNAKLDAPVRWELRDLNNPSEPTLSETSIEQLNEQIIGRYGFSVSVGQPAEVGENRDEVNGARGYEEEYVNADAETWFTGIVEGSIPEGFSSIGVNRIFDYVANGSGEPDEILDPEQALSSIGGGCFIPYYMGNWRALSEDNPAYITPVWKNSGNSIVRNQSKLEDVNNVDIVFTSDKSKWSRCVVIETATDFYSNGGAPTMGDRGSFDLRGSPNVTKEDSDGDGLPDVDMNDPGEGMGWFPGYAIDVETGQRLNIFFGENSWFSCEMFKQVFGDTITTCQVFDDPYNRGVGGDMMWNPTSQLSVVGNPDIYRFITGGQHFIYVTKTPYDECALFRDRLKPSASPLTKIKAIKEITWAGFPMIEEEKELLSYQEGLIPEDLVIKLRVDNPFEVYEGTGELKGYPTYRFTFEGVAPTELNSEEIETALDMINVVPNPYYGYSAYEVSQFTNTVKITNLPAKCTVTIYSLDGKFIRQYVRDEVGAKPDGVNRAIANKQITPALEWDMKNGKGIPVASGMYLMHIDAGEMGERVIKWFGVARQFDPSGL
ncbi:MAG: hypothetical protein GY751_13780 [Bacteroidetes bacterium]|nr:hypothetical protein [Bacteroidota bacterium]